MTALIGCKAVTLSLIYLSFLASPTSPTCNFIARSRSFILWFDFSPKDTRKNTDCFAVYGINNLIAFKHYHTLADSQIMLLDCLLLLPPEAGIKSEWPCTVWESSYTTLSAITIYTHNAFLHSSISFVTQGAHTYQCQAQLAQPHMLLHTQVTQVAHTGC